MRARSLIPFILLLLASCQGKENTEEAVHPSIRITEEYVNAFQAAFTVNSVNSVAVKYGVGTSADEAGAIPHSLETGGSGPRQFTLTLNDLEPLTEYVLCARGIGPSGEEGPLQTLTFATVKGPDGLYAWEKSAQQGAFLCRPFAGYYGLAQCQSPGMDGRTVRFPREL